MLAMKAASYSSPPLSASMIEHHQSAVDMAKLSADQAEHEEIKQLSEQIIEAQEREIAQMRQWQQDWGYDDEHSDMDHSME
jgi:uncharacterized protein (DUF305 family)